MTQAEGRENTDLRMMHEDEMVKQTLSKAMMVRVPARLRPSDTGEHQSIPAVWNFHPRKKTSKLQRARTSHSCLSQFDFTAFRNFMTFRRHCGSDLHLAKIDPRENSPDAKWIVADIVELEASRCCSSLILSSSSERLTITAEAAFIRCRENCVKDHSTQRSKTLNRPGFGAGRLATSYLHDLKIYLLPSSGC